MLHKTEQAVDLLISHSQIVVRSRGFDEKLSQWGKGNLAQGAILYDDYVVFDPLPEDAFGAKVILRVVDQFVMDEKCARCIVAPFYVNPREGVEVASATEKFKVEIGLNLRLYSLFYEICEGDEIFYKFTFVPAEKVAVAQYLKDDPWGGTNGNRLVSGKFD